MRTRVAVLRSDSCEPPRVEPLPTFALLEPIFELPLNCGTVFFRISITFVLLPELAMVFASTVMTGMATELAAGVR